MTQESKLEKKKLWTSTPFKKKSVRYYAMWVALYHTCDEHMGQIKMTQKELFAYVIDNPTREECRTRLPSMCDAFSVQVSEEEQHSKDLNSRATKCMEDTKQEDEWPEETEEDEWPEETEEDEWPEEIEEDEWPQEIEGSEEVADNAKTTEYPKETRFTKLQRKLKLKPRNQ